MASKTVEIENLLSDLEEDDYRIIISFIEFLSASRKKKRATESIKAMEVCNNLYEDDKGWDSEEDMIRDLADYRRKRTESIYL